MGTKAFDQLAEDLEASRSVDVEIDAPDDVVDLTWWLLAQVAVPPLDTRISLINSVFSPDRLLTASQLLGEMIQVFIDASNAPVLTLVQQAHDQSSSTGGL